MPFHREETSYIPLSVVEYRRLGFADMDEKFAEAIVNKRYEDAEFGSIDLQQDVRSPSKTKTSKGVPWR